MRTKYHQITPYTTLDGSHIRELMHPATHKNYNQSLAAADVPAGTTTHLHYHQTSEELYHILQGQGTMQLGHEHFPIQPGDTILIPPGTMHRVSACKRESLRILCCCSPPYAHEDTILLEKRRTIEENTAVFTPSSTTNAKG